jgi:hypothetical protein
VKRPAQRCATSAEHSGHATASNTESRPEAS